MTSKQQWYNSNKEYVSKYNHEYHLKNRDKHNMQVLEYSQKHQEARREYLKKYNEENKEILKEKQRHYRELRKQRSLIEAGLIPEPTIELIKPKRPYNRLKSTKPVQNNGLITPDQLNDIILNNQQHLEFIAEQRQHRNENILMSAEDISTCLS